MYQTVLGSTGIIGTELARELRSSYDANIRLVSRNPKQVNGDDNLYPADLTNMSETANAIAGSSIVFFTVGLPLDTQRWVDEFPVITANVIEACADNNAKLVFFDNTYMYPQNESVLTEDTKFSPNGKKGEIRAQMAQAVLEAIATGKISGLIARAPEFYGPGRTMSFTNLMVLHALRKRKDAKVFVSDRSLRTLIHVQDAARATALLGNTPDTYGQTWHLPCDDARMTYSELISYSESLLGYKVHYKVLSKFALNVLQWFKPQLRETRELWPRYGIDNIFVSDKFKQRFPEFKVTTYIEGLSQILKGS